LQGDVAMNIVVPQLGESVIEARVARWLKREGEAIAAGEPLVELETDKIDLEVSAETAGVLSRIERKDGEDVKVGEVLGVMETGAQGAQGATGARSASPAVTAPVAPAAPAAPAGKRSTPTARKVAEEHGVDLSKVAGSGDGGRITKEDVQKLVTSAGTPAPAPAPPAEVGEAPPARSAPPAGAPAPAALVSVASARTEERVRMSKRRATIAKRLVEAQHTAAMLTTFNEVDMSAVQALRARRKEAFQKAHGVNLGLSSFFVKAAVGALKRFPRINAEIQGDEMVLKHYYDIGMAVGAPEGLVVPVLRDADTMSFAGIETAIRQAAAKAKDGTLTLDDLKGGTFSITSGGVFGSLMSTPILNPPQVGILGLHAIKERPIGLGGQIVLRPMMYTALTYDHRIVDGSEAVRFLVRVKELIEDPGVLLIES